MNELRRVIEERFGQKLKTGNSAGISAILQLRDMHANTRDFLVDSTMHVHIHHEPTPNTDNPEAPGEVKLTLDGGQGAQGQWNEFHWHDNAVGQFASRMKIPSAYFRELLKGERWQRLLGATIARRHIASMPGQRWLVRAVGSQVRGILSNSYRRMDSAPIFARFLKEAEESGCVIWNGAMGDVRGYLEVVIPEIHEIKTPNNGTVHIAFGAAISSSDFGQGSLDVRSFYVQGICANGAIRQSLMKRVHLGKRLDHQNFEFAQETYAADTHAMALAVRDAARVALSQATIEKEKANIISLSSKIIEDPEKTFKELPKQGLLSSEIELMEALLRRGDPNDGLQGEFSQWKLQQTITAMARELEPVRMREVQQIAGLIS